jgi:WD40 repeat protein
MIIEELGNGNIVSGSLDNTVVLWNMTSRTKITSFTPYSNEVYCLNYLSDGSLMISGNDAGIYFWNVTTNSPFQITSLGSVFGTPQKPVLSCLVHSNTIYLATSKGTIVTAGPSASSGCAVKTTLSTANNKQLHAVEDLGTIIRLNKL